MGLYSERLSCVNSVIRLYSFNKYLLRGCFSFFSVAVIGHSEVFQSPLRGGGFPRLTVHITGHIPCGRKNARMRPLLSGTARGFRVTTVAFSLPWTVKWNQLCAKVNLSLLTCHHQNLLARYHKKKLRTGVPSRNGTEMIVTKFLLS